MKKEKKRKKKKDKKKKEKTKEKRKKKSNKGISTQAVYSSHGEQGASAGLY